MAKWKFGKKTRMYALLNRNDDPVVYRDGVVWISLRMAVLKRAKFCDEKVVPVDVVIRPAANPGRNP